MSKLFLLSRKETELIPEKYLIPTDKSSGRPDWWWLRSYNFVSESGRLEADCIKKIGNTIYYGNDVCHKGCGVRPAVRLNWDVDPDLNIGDTVVLGTNLDGSKIEWICIDDHLIVTKYTLCYSEYGDNNDYSRSTVKKLLDELENKIFKNYELSMMRDFKEDY